MRIMDNTHPFHKYGSISRRKFARGMFENRECSSQTVGPKFQRRNEFSIRDFPVGCGPNATDPQVRVSEMETASCLLGRYMGQADVKADYIRASVTIAKHKCPQPQQGSDRIEVVKKSNTLESNGEKPLVLSNVVEGLASLNDNIEKNELLMDLNNVGLVDSKKPLKCRASELPMNSHKTETTKGMVRPTGSKLLPPPTQPIKDNNMKNATPSCKYPPRRNISAIRDFPPFCRKSDPRPCQEGCMKSVPYSKVMCFTQEGPEVDERLSNGTAETKLFDQIGGTVIRDFEKIASKNHGMVRNGTLLYDRDVVETNWKTSKDMAQNMKVRGVVGKLGNQPMLLKKNYNSMQKSYSDIFCNKAGTEILGGQSLNKKKSSPIKKEACHYSGKRVLGDAIDSGEDDEESEDFRMAHRSREIHANVPSLGPRNSIWRDGNHSSIPARNKVRETLRLFQVVCRKLLQEDEAKSKQGGGGLRRVDCAAGKIVKSRGKYVNVGKILGPVPGVEVGDEFIYRIELAIVGLHRPLQAGIDYLKQGTKIFATSVVASGAYADNLDDADVLIYMGSGGHMTAVDKKEPEDQKLERGNLALKNSAQAKTPVRVIRGLKEMKATVLSDREKLVCTYTYDGLYVVDEYWQERGPHGKLAYYFKLVRMPGQPELTWNEVKKTRKHKIREGICVVDISRGKELYPICAINTISEEAPPLFKYITSIIYPKWCNLTPSRGCGCKDGCVDSVKCSCAAKNGLQIPYNHNGSIVEVKPLVYECGPTCKCPPSCYNRVSQQGIKFQLEIFKTKSRGWGVRSLNSIPSGGFICEYLGQLLDDKEAELKTGRDEYLFDIGQNYMDLNLCGESLNVLESTGSLLDPCDDAEDCGFTIDAEKYGNIGRFINHSCSPNLFAQSVLYDHEDKRMPHIMLFAAENIPPLKELTYHYNYKIDQVHDSKGNIKKKSCHCGSTECIGRMY